MITETYKSMRFRLKTAGIENPDLEARWILKSVLKISDVDLITGKGNVSPEQNQKIDKIVTRRQTGEPLSRILGEREFYGRNFKLGPATLDPRPDTETLVEIAVDRLKKKFHVKQKTAEITRILDLGTGTGCILITLLCEFPEAYGLATDLSPEALTISLHNVNSLGVKWGVALGEEVRFRTVCGDWAEALAPQQEEQKFDLVVSNPPYIESAVIPNLDENVRNHDPILALDGGPDGLQAYKKIFSRLPDLLKKDGLALLEIGYDQEDAIVRLAEKYRIRVIAIHKDLSGQPRVAEITRGDK